jgi:hypothetical protein
MILQGKLQIQFTKIADRDLTLNQRYGAEIISFGSGSDVGATERQIQIVAPAQDSFTRYLENWL